MTRRIAFPLVFLTIACQYVAPMPAPVELCATNADCADGLRCEAGRCVALTDCVPDCSAVECGADGCGGFCGRCTDGEGCLLGRCVKGCRGDAAACPAGCNEATNTCRCADDAACGAAAVCVEGACADCRASSDCAGGGLCRQGRCVACASDASCDAETDGSRPFCVEGACRGCRASADCEGVVEGLACIDGACGCSTDLECGGDAPVCADGVCDDCKADGCGEGLLCLSGVGCVECAGTDADCVARHGEGATCSETFACVCPEPSCTGLCGAVTTSCGTTRDCGACAGEACDADDDCGDGLACARRAFEGSSIAGEALRGLCLPAAPCTGGGDERDGACFPTCGSDDDCPAHAFCATDLKDATRRFCAFGCRFDGSCGAGNYCDLYLRVCLPESAQSGGECGAGAFCRLGEACLPLSDSGACVPDCSVSDADCLCLHGATGATGACQRPTGLLVCAVHGDCGLQSLCVAGTCVPACVVGETTTLAGDPCGVCAAERLVFDEGAADIATCEASSGEL